MRSKHTVLASALSALLFAAAPSARAASPQQDLEAAEQAYGALQFEDASRAAERVIHQRALSHDQIVRAYRTLARSYAVLDRHGEARDAFILLLAYDPDFQGDAHLGPKVQEPFLEARGFWRGQAARPGLDVVTVLRPREPGTLRVALRDPTHLARRLIVAYRWGSTGAFATNALALAESATIDVPAPPIGVSRLDFFAQALDERDDAIYEAGNANVPRTAIVDLTTAPVAVGASPARAESAPASGGGSVFSSAAFWIVTVGVIAGGAAGGYYLWTRKREETGAPVQATVVPFLQCGAARCN